MEDLHLQSLLPRGTVTYESAGHSSTIDLVLASPRLTEDTSVCGLAGTAYGPDHLAIEAHFETDVPCQELEAQYTFRCANWEAVRSDLANYLSETVSAALQRCVSKAKPSPYVKKWWTVDLTQLRRSFTCFRNQARACRRWGQSDVWLEAQAREAAKRFHDTMRRQKRRCWKDFLAEPTNIWKAAKYLTDSGGSGFAQISRLKHHDGYAESCEAISETLIKSFFPELPEVQRNTQAEAVQGLGEQIDHVPLTIDEVKEAVFRASATMIWHKTRPAEQQYPVCMHRKRGKHEVPLAVNMAVRPAQEQHKASPTQVIKAETSSCDQAPLWYNRLPMELRLIVYEYLLVSYPTGVRTPHFRITRSASGPQLARLDSWKYVKNDNIARVLYSHIFLGTYSQKRGIYHHHPGDRHPNDAELPVDKCIPLVERRENVRRMSARYNQRFDPGHAMMDIFRLVSHLSTIFSELEHVEFTISIKNWCLWLPVLQSGSVEDVEGWIRSLEEEAPKGLSVILQLGNKTPTYVDGWNSAGRELFERFDEEVINKALRKIFRASF
ncbi:Endonuclease/exonuclease/phosphatase [Macrophomina phaseolina MS6]|uniref:Endonuclease/exonuclease/phosphatase n=1 Tax=Macrophomina phaseolina (strain MS6) TaxID=1126212 RepID=K2QJB0_MACPH|nr:Endonuclease/exonuclease/phosphatase [Macrophomina phaseolina MS6]